MLLERGLAVIKGTGSCADARTRNRSVLVSRESCKTRGRWCHVTRLEERFIVFLQTLHSLHRHDCNLRQVLDDLFLLSVVGC